MAADAARLEGGCRPRRALVAVLGAAGLVAMVASCGTSSSGPALKAGAEPSPTPTPADRVISAPLPGSGYKSVTVVAGNGRGGFTGDGTAVEKSLWKPGELAASADGSTMYFVDSWNNRVRAIDVAKGTLTTVAGSGGRCGVADRLSETCGNGGPAKSAQLNRPAGIALSADGATLYIADTGSNMVRAVDLAGGTISQFAGSGEGGFADGPAASAKLAGPSDVAVSGDGSVYVADTDNNKIRLIAGGAVSTIAGTSSSCADPTGDCGDGGDAADASLRAPMGVAVVPESLTGLGKIIIADTGDHKIRSISADGKMSTVAGTGTAGSLAGEPKSLQAQLSSPQGLSFTPAGHLIISDPGSNVAIVGWKATTPRLGLSADTLMVVAGNGTSGFSEDGASVAEDAFSSPASAVYVPGSGLWISDTGNERIRVASAPTADRQVFDKCGPASGLGGRAPSAVALLLPGTTVTAEAWGAAGGAYDVLNKGGRGGYAASAVTGSPYGLVVFTACAGTHPTDTLVGGGGASGVAVFAPSDAYYSNAPVVVAGGGGGGCYYQCNDPGSGSNGGPMGQGGKYQGGHDGKGGVSAHAGEADGHAGLGGWGGNPESGGGYGFTWPAGDLSQSGEGGSAYFSSEGRAAKDTYALGSGGGGWGGGAGATYMFNVFEEHSPAAGGGSYSACDDKTQSQQLSESDGRVVLAVVDSGPKTCSVSTASKRRAQRPVP